MTFVTGCQVNLLVAVINPTQESHNGHTHSSA